MYRKQHKNWALSLTLAAVTTLVLSGCFELKEEDDTRGSNSAAVKLSMALPDSMTGGSSGASTGKMLGLSTRTTGSPCLYPGVADDEPFKNGYNMTKFMTSAVATWTCIADTVIEIVDFIPHDGTIYETENVVGAPSYKVDDPTHYSVTDDSDTQISVRLYYAYDRATPPTADSHPGFYVSWASQANDEIEGRLIIDVSEINPGRENKEDPTTMRMDFNYTAERKFATMYLAFDDNNVWADGFRIELTEDLLANPLNQVFTARGLMAMKAQFSPAEGISELPHLQMYTVADQMGEGAAVAEFVDLSLNLNLNAGTGNHLGNYIFTKNDQYFFDADQSTAEPWDYIYKTVTQSEYRGGRTTPATGGTWIPFSPSLDMIVTALELDADYFTGTACANVADDCTPLLNAIFRDGFADQEPNQGSDPGDWRSTAIGQAAYLNSVYPNGSNWQGAFDMTFIPSP